MEIKLSMDDILNNFNTKNINIHRYLLYIYIVDMY